MDVGPLSVAPHTHTHQDHLPLFKVIGTNRKRRLNDYLEPNLGENFVGANESGMNFPIQASGEKLQLEKKTPT